MPSLGVPELAIILVIIIIIFGAGKLPEIGGALGRGIREFRDSASDDDESEETTEHAEGTTTTPQSKKNEPAKEEL